MTVIVEEIDSLSSVGKVRGTSLGSEGVATVVSAWVDVGVGAASVRFDVGAGAASVGVDGGEGFVVDRVQVAKRFVTCSRSRRSLPSRAAARP